MDSNDSGTAHNYCRKSSRRVEARAEQDMETFTSAQKRVRAHRSAKVRAHRASAREKQAAKVRAHQSRPPPAPPWWKDGEAQQGGFVPETGASARWKGGVGAEPAPGVFAAGRRQEGGPAAVRCSDAAGRSPDGASQAAGRGAAGAGWS